MDPTTPFSIENLKDFVWLIGVGSPVIAFTFGILWRAKKVENKQIRHEERLDDVDDQIERLWLEDRQSKIRISEVEKAYLRADGKLNTQDAKIDLVITLIKSIKDNRNE